MGEAEWYASSDPVAMLAAIQPVANPKRLRLLGCRCCRLIWDLLADPRSRAATEVAERFAAGSASAEELYTAYDSADMAVHEAGDTLGEDEMDAAYLATTVGRAVAYPFDAKAPWTWVIDMSLDALGREGRGRQDWLRLSLCEIARDMFPRPLRPMNFLTMWRTHTAVSLARTMCELQDFSAMPILADALQDAGCADEQILMHCRGVGPHTCDCWVIDSVLGKG